MPVQDEIPLVLRRFDGVVLLVDQAQLGPSYLRGAQNFIPGETFRLTKAPGGLPYAAGAIPNALRTRALARVYLGASRYLYAATQRTPLPGGTQTDELWFTTDDGPWARVQAAGGGDLTFTTDGADFDIEEQNGFVYVGNGIDPIQRIPVGGTATPLDTILAFTDGAVAPTLVPDPGAQFLSGTYAYTWCIFDDTLAIWLEQSQTRTVKVDAAGSDLAIAFPTPTNFVTNGGVLSARYQAHLFVAPVGLPVEFAHNQTTGGVVAAGTVALRLLTGNGPPVPLRGPARTGTMLRGHRGRLFIAGVPTSPDAVFATMQVVPGNEQAIFNTGLYFPVNARTPRVRSTVTGIALAATGRDEPDAPLVVCTLTSTWLYYGDILDDPAAAFIEVSSRIGCLNSKAIIETPVGTFYIGRESVYCIPPGGGPPIDVGWPIRPIFLNMPPNGYALARALYHKGFLKIAVVPPGSNVATQQWWLDLRRGIGQIPSWWGPSPRSAVGAWCVGEQDPTEPDAGFVAIDEVLVVGTGEWDVSLWDVDTWGTEVIGGYIERLHQPNTYSELAGGRILVSILQSGDLDNGKPFDRKLVTCLRATAFPGAATSLGVSVSVDASLAGDWDAMEFPGAEGSLWDAAEWDVATWGEDVLAEGEVQAPEDDNPLGRPRGRTIAFQLIHADPVAISFRDFEVRYLPVARPGRLLPDDGQS